MFPLPECRYRQANPRQLSLAVPSVREWVKANWPAQPWEWVKVNWLAQLWELVKAAKCRLDQKWEYTKKMKYFQTRKWQTAQILKKNPEDLWE